MYLCEVVIVSQLCIFPLYLLHGLCEDYLTCDIAFNEVMPLSRASTRGRYSRIEGVTSTDILLPPIYTYCWRSGNGGPQTCLRAACGVAQVGAQHGPSSSAQAQDPREGPSLAGRTRGGFLRGSLIRQAHEEAEKSRQVYLARSP